MAGDSRRLLGALGGEREGAGRQRLSSFRRRCHQLHALLAQEDEEVGADFACLREERKVATHFQQGLRRIGGHVSGLAVLAGTLRKGGAATHAIGFWKRLPQLVSDRVGQRALINGLRGAVSGCQAGSAPGRGSGSAGASPAPPATPSFRPSLPPPSAGHGAARTCRMSSLPGSRCAKAMGSFSRVQFRVRRVASSSWVSSASCYKPVRGSAARASGKGGTPTHTHLCLHEGGCVREGALHLEGGKVLQYLLPEVRRWHVRNADVRGTSECE